MVRRRRRSQLTLDDLPPELLPDYDRSGSPEEARKAAFLNKWLFANDLSFEYSFEFAPKRLAERRKAAGLPPSPPARRRGPLPPEVVAELEAIERSGEQSSDLAEGETSND